MLRKIASIVFLLTGIAIALGALGHDSNVARLSAEFAKAPQLDAGMVAVTIAVWHFCSGCMFVFGAICVWTWWRAHRGERRPFLPAYLIGVFYVATGIGSVLYTGRPFFWVFALLGLLLILPAMALRSES